MTEDKKGEWQPIASAPTEIDDGGRGPVVLCWDGNEVFTAAREIDGSWRDAQDYYGRERFPTHWQPTPEPPVEA